ncbi:MAG: hypothetical protein FWC69_00230 [Defluviitaleaceae bacterium]|nr:hypothetical protein [Defluviitaleaceae bacterium]
MRNHIKKLFVLLFLFGIMLFTGCGDTTGDGITLTIVEQQWIRHAPQPPRIATREVMLDDTITLECIWSGEVAISIREIHEDFVVISYEYLYRQPIRPTHVAEVRYGEEYKIYSPTLSSWFEWTLVFER